MDNSNFVNTGRFWELYPDVFPGVTRFEITNEKGSIVESWERGKDGIMHETTARDKAREELIAAQKAMEKYIEEDDDDGEN